MARPSDAPAVLTCFGYGSLVNEATLPAGTPVARVRLRGWRRTWRHAALSPSGRRCTLTVRPEEDCVIDGLVIGWQAASLSELDRREGRYSRRAVDAATIEWLDSPPQTWPDPFIYVGDAAWCRPGDVDHPIMLSYLDVVIAGFRRAFGDDGVSRFAATTDDWHVPVFNDRASPRYARALALSAGDLRRVDRFLAELSIVPLQFASQPSSVSATR